MFYKYPSRGCRLSPTSRDRPNIILTSLLSGVWLAFSPNIGVFCLHERALLVTRHMFTCLLATTLGVAVCYNTTIRLEYVRCALVACGVKYVCQLATTLDVVVHCNTAIRLESVRCALMTYG